MAFLFKSKKHASNNESKASPPASSTTALPPVARNIHTSDGTVSSPPAQTQPSDRFGDRPVISPPAIIGPSTSLNSVTSPSAALPNGQFARRERSDSELGSRPPNNAMAQIPNAALYPWSQRRLNFPNSQASPFPRYGAAVNAVASKDGDVYMMGGLINGTMVRGDLWMLETGGGHLSCYPIATVSEGPGPRVGHASLLVGNAFIVFGGDTKINDSDVLDDALYLLNTSSRQWSIATPPGPRPSGRYGHTLNILGSKIYIFGGQVEGYFFNDLVAFDLNALQNPSNQWELLIPSTSDDEKPANNCPLARTNHTVISYMDQLYLFGGTNGTTWFNDVWTYDPRTNSWTKQDCIGYIPAPREGHAAALVGDVMYVFGGRTEEGVDLGDLAAFRIPSRRWYTFQNMGPSPSPRSGHSMTAFGKQILVIAGEPSTQPRDPGELSMAYVLDTAKIKYPNDASASTPGQSMESHRSEERRKPSIDARTGNSASRSVLRTDSLIPANAQQKPSGQTPPLAAGQINSSTSRLPRTSAPQGSGASSPAQVQASSPRVNGVTSPPAGFSNKSSPATEQPKTTTDTVRSPQSTASVQSVQSPPIKQVQRETPRLGSESNSSTQGRRTPTQQVTSKAKAMELGEAAPLMSGGVARQRSHRSQRAHTSMDSEDGHMLRSGSSRHHSDNTTEGRSYRSTLDEPKSPKLNTQQESLIKELEAAKRNNAWYASELALARKAGYFTTKSASPVLEDESSRQFADEDRALIEVFMNMKAELTKVQEAMDQQSASTAKRIAEVEQQRDAAVTEAAYARAKLAAHSGSQRSTPQPDAARDADESERSSDLARRLAASLAAQSEVRNKLEVANNHLTAEKRAREVAEESAEALQKRIDELDLGRNPVEVEGMRAELHDAQSSARREAAERASVEEQFRMLQIDHKSLTKKHTEASAKLANHVSSLAALEAAVTASNNKHKLYESQLEEQRQQREEAENKLADLQVEHESRSRELEKTSNRLRDAKALAETNAQEAETHRNALMAGLARLASSDGGSKRDSTIDQRFGALQESAERANELAKRNQEAADTSAQKLRNAEERIAGLEAYQEQSSREGLQIRRQLQTALREAQTHQQENRELKATLESHQRDASALAVQHGALKGLLTERGINLSDTKNVSAFEMSPSSRYGTPDQSRLRDLEQQLHASLREHEDSKHQFESRMAETDTTYREKLEQLENDYQSAVHYVKGTEKLVKKMREELTKYKTQNSQLQTELSSKRSVESAAATDSSNWSTERHSLQAYVEDLRNQLQEQKLQTDTKLAALQNELASARQERDLHRETQQKTTSSIRQNEKQIEQLRHENQTLQTKADEAERRVNMLLEQVGQSVSNYRRRSQMPNAPVMSPNGYGHAREASEAMSADDSSHYGDTNRDDRDSLALDSFATELERLRSQWESSSRNNSYRLSNQSEVDHAARPSDNRNLDLGENAVNWRRRLDQEEHSTSRSLTSPTGRAPTVPFV